MGYRTTIDVRFGDCDPAGIVYYPVLYHYCHVAFELAWADALGVPYHFLVADRRLGFPTVHVVTGFERPARYGDRVVFDVSVPRIGVSSVDFRFEGSVSEDTILCSVHTKVCTDLTTLESTPIPGDLRSAIEGLVR
jgi:4-hydroxybenzoyl-CoA thioesterase